MKVGFFLAGFGCLVHVASARHTLSHAHRRAHEAADDPTRCLDARQEVEYVTLYTTQFVYQQPPPTPGQVVHPGPQHANAAQPAPAVEENRPRPGEVKQGTNTDGQKGGYGVTYSPFKADGKCRSGEDVRKDFETFQGVYSTVRLYGADCISENYIASALAAAKDFGLRLMLGVYEVDDPKLEEGLNHIIAAVGGNWNYIHSVSIGNERVDNQFYGYHREPEAVVSAVGKARKSLREAGFGGPVLTVDTFQAVIDHPELCEASDYCGVNIHPFFDGTHPASNARAFIEEKMEAVASKVGGKDVYVTETGWPWAGSANNQAVPSLDQQATALGLIRELFAGNPSRVFFLASFNERWKSPTDNFGVERFWGMGGIDAPSGP